MHNPKAVRERAAATAIVRSAAVATAVAAIAFIAASEARAADPDALWRVVHDLCVTDMKLTGAPAPCTAVDLTRGYAVLKDLRGPTQHLLVPTARISGIDSPRLLSPGSVNYWQAAWEARRFLEKPVGREMPREDIALAINSRFARSQNQLHIHIDCVRADVRQALQTNQRRIGGQWSRLNVPLAGHRYRARRLMGADLGARDPFKILATGDAKARADMGRETLVVIGETFADGRPGFVLLSDRADLARFDVAAGEELMDHKCAVLDEPRNDTPQPG
ncbi:MAG TPA: CDP-diacylglycerol diphosphatase [Caulobacteraceae bacterium]